MYRRLAAVLSIATLLLLVVSAVASADPKSEQIYVPVNTNVSPPPIPAAWLQRQGAGNLHLVGIAGTYYPEGTGYVPISGPNYGKPDTTPSLAGNSIALVFQGDNGKTYIVTDNAFSYTDLGGYKMVPVPGIAGWFGSKRPDAPYWHEGTCPEQKGLDSSYSAFAAYTLGMLQQAAVPITETEASAFAAAADTGFSTNPRSWVVVEAGGFATAPVTLSSGTVVPASPGTAARDAAAGWRCDIEKLQEVLL